MLTMTSDFARLWALGYTSLVPIVPPDADVSEHSSLFKRVGTRQDSRGKSPGVQGRDGKWRGFDWLPHVADEQDLTRWDAMGAGVGIKTGKGLIAIDADTMREDLAEIVRDAVDVLVDLGGHTSSQRLGVFAMGAAPVQATYLGYPHSTGLAFMDWLIGDQTVSPAEHAHLFSEGIAQLPGCVFCWAPVDDYPLPAARPANSPPVFGSFNNSIKIGPRTVALWSRVLQAVPDSQLLLKAPALKDASVQRAFVEMFQAQGIAPQRLLLRGPGGLAQMMQEYGDIDIALDPAPYNGGTTSLQALWMGLPLVTLQGSNFAGRMGASFMRALGRPEWVARDADGYVAIASKLAESCAALRAGRAELRRQMHASPLCDIRAHTRQLEALFDKMWQLHCAGDTTRLIKPPAPESAPRKSPGRPG